MCALSLIVARKHGLLESQNSRMLKFQGCLPHSKFRDPSLSKKPPETQGKRIRFLKRRIVEKNGVGINP